MKRAWVKCICAVFCVISLTAGVWGGVFSLIWYDRIPASESFYDSSLCWRVTNDNLALVEEYISLTLTTEKSYSGQQRQKELAQALERGSTNFRYICSTEDGRFLHSNVTGEETWWENVYQTYTRTVHVDGYTDTGYDIYGDFVASGYYEMIYTIEFGVAAPLAVEDAYWQAQTLFERLNDGLPIIAGISAACLALGLLLLIMLIRFAGRRAGREDVALNLQDRFPYDLYLALSGTLITLCCALLVEGMYYLDQGFGPFWAGGASLGVAILGLALILTTATRVKARTILRNTVVWRLCRWLWRMCARLWSMTRAAGAALPLIWKAALVCGIYLLGSMIAMGMDWFYYPGRTFLWLLCTLALLAYVCWWVLQWKRIRTGTREIVGGDPDYHIDSRKMPPDLKEHADELNSLSQAISAAVDERLKSEHFKTELITNVSHDLKTPLTSIINYVDLLKKEDIQNETAREYIEVLDRKSQRLKKLTEDLVEASKASTGALTVNKERLDLAQLIRQATGEYEEKLADAGLTLVLKLPEEPVYIHADGRHVWRVLDNLLGNCAKYALEGTRIYLDAAAWEGKAVVTVKNVSRQALDIPAERLVERFVRGDESRATEGSGLGLSIARSLVELQGGQFSLDIDGDLFKARVVLPLA